MLINTLTSVYQWHLIVKCYLLNLPSCDFIWLFRDTVSEKKFREETHFMCLDSSLTPYHVVSTVKSICLFSSLCLSPLNYLFLFFSDRLYQRLTGSPAPLLPQDTEEEPAVFSHPGELSPVCDREHPDQLHHSLVWELLSCWPQSTAEGGENCPTHHRNTTSCYWGHPEETLCTSSSQHS